MYACFVFFLQGFVPLCSVVVLLFQNKKAFHFCFSKHKTVTKQTQTLTNEYISFLVKKHSVKKTKLKTHAFHTKHSAHTQHTHTHTHTHPNTSKHTVFFCFLKKYAYTHTHTLNFDVLKEV